MKQPATRVLSVFAQPWLLAPSALQDLREIALRVHTPDLQAVLEKRGHRLDGTKGVTMREGVAIVSVFGPIFRHSNLFTDISGASSIEILARDFRTAVDNSKVKAVVLNFDSPGGEVRGTSEFAQQIRAARDVKPIVGFVGGMAASAAYWLASATSRIVIADTASLGSVGVVASFLVGDDPEIVEVVSSQSPKKRLDVRTDEGKAEAQRHVDELASVFVDAVAANRGVTIEKVLTDFGKGSVLIGRSAVRAGLADAIGTLEGVIAQYGKADGNKPTMVQRDIELPQLAQLVAAHGLDRAYSVYVALSNERAKQLESQRAKQ